MKGFSFQFSVFSLLALALAAHAQVQDVKVDPATGALVSPGPETFFGNTPNRSALVNALAASGSFATAGQGATADALALRLAGSGTLTVTESGTAVTTSGTQTLTNKTLVDPTLSGTTTVAGTLVGDDGNVHVRGSIHVSDDFGNTYLSGDQIYSDAAILFVNVPKIAIGSGEGPTIYLFLAEGEGLIEANEIHATNGVRGNTGEFLDRLTFYYGYCGTIQDGREWVASKFSWSFIGSEDNDPGNATNGTVVLSSGTASISSGHISSDSIVVLSRKSASGAAKMPLVTVDTGEAQITGESTDNGTYNWGLMSINAAPPEE